MDIEWSIGPNPAKIIRGQREIEITLQSGVTPINVAAKVGGQKLMGSASLKVEINLTK
jgi:hypothetical protein